MKTSDSKLEQKTPTASVDSKNIQNKNNISGENSKEDSSNEEIRMVDEKNMVGQPMGNHIQNSNFKHQTPIDKTNEKNFSEGDSNSMKEKLQTETPEIDVIESLKKSSGKTKPD